jgi:hypothetical protein
MARVNLIRGTIHGRFGAFVGSKWRGKHYIKLYKELLGCYNITGLDSKRFFTKDDKKILYEKLDNGNTRAKKLCPHCLKEYSFDDFEIDHRTAWSKGGRTDLNNADLLCKKCNASKGNK